MEKDDWLNGADGIVIECEEDNITPYTLISVTPLYLKGVKIPKGSEGQRTMMLKEALKINKRLVVKNSPKLIDYLQTRIGKDVFD